MEYRAFVLFSSLLVCAITNTSASPLSSVDDELIDKVSEKFEDPEIEELAKKEYETVHDRILAVNEAHYRKRGLNNKNKDDNEFDRIEADNEKLHENLYQGDIQMDEDMEEFLHKPVRSRTKRNAVRTKTRLWTSRVIPYTVPGYMSHIKPNLNIAIADFQKNTCLRFVRYRPGVHRNYITFGNQDGCSSKIGKKYHSPGKQTVSIGPGCNQPGTIIHEMLHALGFFHEQARSDRDKFVSIKWENIKRGFSDQFDKYSWKTIDMMGQTYDYSSIMHYGRFAFTSNRQPTVIAIGDPKRKFGNAKERLSNGDIIELNALYDCKVKTYGWTKWSEFTPCDDNCYKTRERYCYHPGNMKYCGGKVNRYGIEKQKIKCTKMECLARNSISGNWGPWSHWSDCSAKCDDGAHSRVRLCNNPAPSKYGRKCAGPAKEEAICTMGRCNPKPEDTDFDDSNRPFGMWRTAPGSQLPWRRNKEFTQTMNTGPMKDHTTGKGYYLYIESSGAHTKNKNAKVISATLTGKPGGQCFKFFYTMYGKTIGSLEVALLQNGRKVKTLFYKAGDQGPNWIYGTASIDKVQGKYQIEIIGTVRDRGYSDIAIDDVYIDDGLCSCQDKYISCKSWSSKGECRKNKDWMSKNCPRSCYICRKNPIRPAGPALAGPAPAGPAPVGPAGPSSPLICEDKNKDQCPLWAKQGECDKNKDYMHNNCRKSCNICKAPPCEDKEKTNCPAWAKKGECDKNKDYMHKNCQKSCKICKAGEECDDNDKYKDQCSIWVKKDECRKNKKWMETNCRKSCNACGCKDQQSGCQSWAKKGECDSNPAFMHVFCKKACGKC